MNDFPKFDMMDDNRHNYHNSIVAVAIKRTAQHFIGMRLLNCIFNIIIKQNHIHVYIAKYTVMLLQNINIKCAYEYWQSHSLVKYDC